jgi:hypothetical protein
VEALVNLVIQIIAGIVGGNGAAAALKDYDLGKLGNTIAGAVGGGVGGQLLQVLLPALAGAGGLDIGALLGHVVGGGGGGAILTIIIGVVKSLMAGRKAA